MDLKPQIGKCRQTNKKHSRHTPLCDIHLDIFPQRGFSILSGLGVRLFRAVGVKHLCWDKNIMKHLTIISRRGREMRCLFCIFLLASLLHIVFLKGFMWDPGRLLPFFFPFNYDKLSNCVLFYCTLQLGIWERPTYIICFKLLNSVR